MLQFTKYLTCTVSYLTLPFDVGIVFSYWADQRTDFQINDSSKISEPEIKGNMVMINSTTSSWGKTQRQLTVSCHPKSTVSHNLLIWHRSQITSGSNPGPATLGKSLNLSEPQFPHLSNRKDSRIVVLKQVNKYKAIRTIPGTQYALYECQLLFFLLQWRG